MGIQTPRASSLEGDDEVDARALVEGHLDRAPLRSPDVRHVIVVREGDLIHVDVKKLGRIPAGGGCANWDAMPGTGIADARRVWIGPLETLGARHITIRPHRPQTIGKAERFNRTLLEEWAYNKLYRSNEARLAELATFLDFYNRRRPHTALGGRSPMDGVSTT